MAGEDGLIIFGFIMTVIVIEVAFIVAGIR